MSALPPFGRALRFWLKLGCISFGGPTGQIAIMHTELVERRGWIGEPQYLRALNFCMLLPGPEAQQLATYIGWTMHGARGGLAAGALFVLPSVGVLLALSWLYLAFGQVPLLTAVFHALKAAVVGIVAYATLRIARRALRHPLHGAIAAAAFGALFLLRAPFPLVIAGAAAAGFAGTRLAPRAFAARPGHAGPGAETAGAVPAARDGRGDASAGRAARVLALFAALWGLPYLALLAWRGAGDVLVREALFFTKAALVTFGGAYAVLPYVAQQAVEVQGWLTAPEMIDGLALAETTPGPLIMVLQFVGFMAGARQAADLGMGGAVAGALVATWFTFLPSFLWIFLGAPFVERGHRFAALQGALAAITAAVVGVVLNLAVWFGAAVLAPAGRPDLLALLVAPAAFAALQWTRWGIVRVVAAAAALGLLAHAAATWRS